MMRAAGALRAACASRRRRSYSRYADLPAVCQGLVPAPNTIRIAAPTRPQLLTQQQRIFTNKINRLRHNKAIHTQEAFEWRHR